VTAAHRFGRPVTVCGEMAANPEGCLALVALGVDSLSVPVNQLNAVRRRLSNLPSPQLRELRPALLQQKTSRQVRELLHNWDSSGV
jgi:phosphoenolpyruvate-protein kinase (PTS system EI component)